LFDRKRYVCRTVFKKVPFFIACFQKSVITKGRRVNWEAAQLNAEKEIFFLIRYCSEAAAIDTEHFRIIFRGQVYNITFIDNVKYQNKTIKLRAVLEKR